MATESPMRIVESRGARKWPSSKDSSSLFNTPLNSMAAEKLGKLMQDHIFNGENADSIPSRSGSAPPSMEGSFAAIGNLLAQKNFSLSLESLSNAIENCESEEQLRSDPTYFAYYCTNINLNPRLPPPLMSQENRRLVRHIGGLGNSWKSGNFDGNGDKELLLCVLSSHKEESEDDRSPGEDSDNSGAAVYEQNMTTLAGRHKSLVDLIQEDFPRTPSPVYSQTRSLNHGAEEAADLDINSTSPNISSLNISKGTESNSGSSEVVDTLSLEVDALRLVSNNDPTSSPNLDEKQNQLKDDSTLKGTFFEGQGVSRTEPRMKNKQEEQPPYGRFPSQNYSLSQQGTGIPHQGQGVHSQVISQGLNQPHSHSRFPTGAQPSFHSPGLNYPSNTAYLTGGTPFVPNFQPSGPYPPQYGMGGYAMDSGFLSPFMTGYPPHSTVPMAYGGSSPNFDAQTPGEKSQHIGPLQQTAKFYGQQGLMLQPPYMDPLYMQYFPNPFGDTYGTSYQQSSGAITNGSLGSQSFGNVGATSNEYFRGPLNMGVMPQFPAPPLATSSLPSSPIGGVGHIGRRNDARFPQASSRNMGVYSGGQGQRGGNSFDDPKRHYFLEELKSSNSRKFELSDIAGHIVEFSVDQHGSRFIQQKLEHCSVEEKASVFKEVVPHASKLMTDVFGNYVIQKFFEHGSPEQRKELADKLSGQMLQLSLQMYGCRVIQKALEVTEIDQKTHLVQELDGHVLRCVHDQNGNHVIQKCIECLPTKNIEFIISAFRDQVAALATHPYGCRVIQRVLEHCSEEQQSQCIVDEILESAHLLAQDQYGNYVTQHVLEMGKPDERSQIISKLFGKIVPMSQHKYASNVIEKCLEYGSPAEQELLIDEIIGQSDENGHFLIMMKDQFANYVVQKILEISNDRQREILLNCIRENLNALKKYTYGKHIVARFEQL